METTNEKKPNDEHFGHRHWHHSGRKRWIKIPFIIVAVVLIKSALIYHLWNYLVPDLFHGPEVTYLQAVALMILAKLLVGFGWGGGSFRHFGGRHHHMGWKKQWLEHLSPEERKKFNDKLRKHVCHK